MKLFSERLQSLREAHNFSKTKAANKAGVALSTYANWEYGYNDPDMDMLKKLAKIFDTTTDYLTGNTDDPTKPDENSKNDKEISLDDDMPVMYHGYNVPEKYLNMVRGLMDADIKEGKAGNESK